MHVRAHLGAPALAVGENLVHGLLLYWTSEPHRKDAFMSLPYRPEEAGRYFDETVRRIQTEKFEVTTPPAAAICGRSAGARGVIRRSEVFA